MDLRKIQRTSSGTFFVCLPKAWAEQNGLDRGSIVSVTELSDGQLAINPKYNLERVLKIAIIKPTHFLDREIIEKYLLGYDVIQIKANERISPTNREHVKKTSSRLVGLEIVEEDHSEIIMQCLLEPSTFPPRKILRREYSISSGMHRDAVTALIEGDLNLAKNVVARDDEVDRLYFLLVRTLRTIIQNPSLSEKLEILPIDCLDFRLTASFIESIGDQSASIGKQTISLGGSKISKNLLPVILEFHKVVYQAHENAMNAMFSHNVSMAESVRSEEDKTRALFHGLETAVRDQPKKIVTHILTVASLINRIFDNSLDVADLVMPKLLQ